MLPISSDSGKKFYTTLCIEYKSLLKKPILLEEFIKSNVKKSDEFASVFILFFDALKSNSIEGIKPLVSLSRSEKNTAAEKLFNFRHRIYNRNSKSNNIYLLYRVIGEDQQAFIWGIKKNNIFQITGEALFVKKENRIFWSWNLMKTQSLNTLIGILYKNPRKIKEANDKYEYSTILADSTDSQLIRLKFNGKKYNYKLYEASKTGDKFIYLYVKAKEALEKSSDDYAKFLTPKSASSFLKRIKKYPQIKGILKKKNDKKIISFIMEAKPFYIVFYRFKNEKIRHFSRFDYLIETGTGLKFSNYGCIDRFEQQLRKSIKSLNDAVYPPVGK
jgi:hypothetical protein